MDIPGLSLSKAGAFGVSRKIPGRVNSAIFEFLCGSIKKRRFGPRGRDASTSGFKLPRQPVQDPINAFGLDLARRIGMPELTVSGPPLTDLREIETAAAFKTEDVEKVAAEILKSVPVRAGKTIEAIADEKVNAAVGKLTTEAAKDLKEARTLKKKNTELSQRVDDLTKQLTDLRNQIKTLQEKLQ